MNRTMNEAKVTKAFNASFALTRPLGIKYKDIRYMDMCN